MLHSFILQYLPEGFWNIVVKQAPLAGLSLVGIVVLWRTMLNKEKKCNERHDQLSMRLEGYLAEDRRNVTQALNNNTTALQEVKEAMSFFKFRVAERK